MSLETSNASETSRYEIFEDDRDVLNTHSSPASPVSVASLEGFSNRHSRPAWRQRLHGGLSAPSQRIFCFLHAFL